jgi:hypothetical protein
LTARITTQTAANPAQIRRHGQMTSRHQVWKAVSEAGRLALAGLPAAKIAFAQRAWVTGSGETSLEFPAQFASGNLTASISSA